MTNPSTPDFNNYIVNSIATGVITAWSLTTDKGKSAGSSFSNEDPEAAQVADTYLGEWGSAPAGKWTKDPRPLQFLQELILNLDQERPDLPKQITRAEMLHRRQRIAAAGGMRDRSQPVATLQASIKNKVGEGTYSPTPNGQPYSLDIEVNWFHDKTIILSCEFPVTGTVIEDATDGGRRSVTKAVGLVDLYVVKGCEHRFEGRTAGRCYTIYTCSKCGHTYDIDSSD